MITSAKVLEQLGRVSILFSTLEADLGDLLSVLVHEEEPLLAATVLERNTFARTLELLRKVAPFKGAPVEAKITRLLATAEPLRQRRNLFVHGCWNLSPKILDQGKVEVSDSKIKFVRNGNQRSWHKGTKHILTYEELRAHQLEILHVIKLTGDLLQRLTL